MGICENIKYKRVQTNLSNLLKKLLLAQLKKNLRYHNEVVI
jgi:hypothetical protein